MGFKTLGLCATHGKTLFQNGKECIKCLEAADEPFEIWLKTVCFEKPTPEAYDLAKEAWKAGHDHDPSKPLTIETGKERLWSFFGLSYASWLTIPRVMLHEMSNEWQVKLADLLEEYDLTFSNQPNIGTRVQVTDLNGKLIKTPAWLSNYRHPDFKQLQAMKAVVYKEKVTP